MFKLLYRLFQKQAPKIDENSFFAILEAIPVSVVISDANKVDSPIIFCNHTFELVTGYRNEEVVGLNCRFLQGEKTDQHSTSKIKDALKKFKPVNVVILNYKKSGEEFFNELIITPVIGQNGNRYFVGIQNDIGKPTYISSKKESEAVHGRVDKGDRL